MSNQVSRRHFFQKSALASAAATGLAAISRDGAHTAHALQATANTSPAIKSLVPKMLLGGTAALSKPWLTPSQVSFRLGLARTRTAAYPMSTDFIMMDLERPDGRSRHATWCTGDLSGRLLEFLSCAEGVDGKSDPRLGTLFERILKQRRPSGIIGRYGPASSNPSPEDAPMSTCTARLSCGLMRYYDLTEDARALEAAVGLADHLWTLRDSWRQSMQNLQARTFSAWASEFFAQLHGATKDARWLELCGMVRDNLGLCDQGCHAHAFMSTLRGLQQMAMITGDRSWCDKAKKNRRMIIEKKFEMPDGCTPEIFPHSERNEGCSIADWLMLNLNAGLIHGDDTAYEKAERIFWNALAFNQLITGSFGQRNMTSDGYGLNDLAECVWCCLHNGGMALSQYARHAVTYREGAICVNLLVPGRFEVPLPGGRWAAVKIETNYPTRAEATIEAENVPADVSVRLRVPTFVRKPDVRQTRTDGQVRVAFHGELRHRIEQCRPGVIVTYGPLVLVPDRWNPNPSEHQAADNAAPPVGYVPRAVLSGAPTIKLDGPPDAEGFVLLPTCPGERRLPDWSCFDEGPGAPTWIEGAAVEAQLKFPLGSVLSQRLVPMCYFTSVVLLSATPVVFRDLA
jgi:hypothetical protein